MQIRDIAARTGLPKDTIRYYEKIGLLAACGRTRRANNYRDYPETVVELLTFIKHLKVLGFTLTEIAEIGRLWQSGHLTEVRKLAMLEEKDREVDDKIRELHHVKAYLQEKMTHVRGLLQATPN